ncbi:MAG: response regulator [Phycisphaeraceae bacterium]|nr:response regulator [Phycisphaeraceae bacterium]
MTYVDRVSEQTRLEALLECAILDTEPEPEFDDVVRLAANICEAPIALVSLIDETRQWFKARVGLTHSQTPRSIAFCKHAILSDEPLIVPDARLDERFFRNPMVTGSPGVRFYAGVPLVVGGLRMGTLCVKDTRPRELTDAQVFALKTLARQVAGQLEIRRSIRRLEAVQQELLDATVAAAAASRAKSEFLTNMSHEIRTPLTAIIGYADLLADPENGSFDASEGVSTIRRSAHHLLSLINAILDLSRIEAGGAAIELGVCNPRALAMEVGAECRPLAAAKGVEIEVEVDADVPSSVRTDPHRLRQIVLNLMGNAVKFTAGGRVTVRVSAPGPSRLAISVQDTGIGIPRSMHEAIFNPFVQADGSTTRRYGGTGLGLTISRRLARMLGGDIVVESEPGRGSRFEVCIEAPVAAGSAAAARAVRAGSADLRTALAGRRILVAEDGPDNQRLIRHFLTRAGADVHLVENGQEAIHQFAAHAASGTPFDLLLLDMQMPVMDGYEAARALRGMGNEIPILALTAHALVGAETDCLSAGCTAYLSKPVDFGTLVQKCRDLVESAEWRGVSTAKAG